MAEGLRFVDLCVIVAVMAAVTWLGHRLSGAIESRRGFFQGDGSLPWWAVSASILATLVSAVTFVSVPAAVFAPGGDLTYFQVILGLALGKIAVGLMLARPFYLSRGVETSYAYIGARLDPVSGEASMYLGLLLTIINAGVKLLTASLVLDVITDWGIPGCALFVVVVSVLWSALAGIKTVIWTDFLLFILFGAGALFILVFIVLQVQVPLSDALLALDHQAKLVLFDFSTDPTERYTIWAGLIGGVALNIAQGSTQGTWQRVRSCRSAGEAVKAYNFAALFYVVHIVILAVGLALVVFYGEVGLPLDVGHSLREAPDRILPYFVLTEVPAGLSGLLIAAIFAAAISTLDSALAEASDLSVSHFYARFAGQNVAEARFVLVSRLLMGVWGLVFLAVAVFFARFRAEGLLDLTFKFPNYIYGVIFGCILLARIGVGRWQTLSAGAVVACVLVYVMNSAQVAFFYWCPVSGLAMIGVVLLLERARPEWTGIARV